MTDIVIRLLQKIEDSILVGLLLAMIGLAVAQIGLRNFFGSGIVWGDSLVRVLVLWTGLLGAMAASRADNHIRIDVIFRYLPPGAKQAAARIIHAFTAVICLVMAWHSARFVHMEKTDGMTAFAGVPAWVCEIIIPAAFLVMGIRYLLFFMCRTAGPGHGKPDTPPGPGNLS
jgi:TRAP-type C4-dicarboxylate transport system permease small subunit